MAEPKPLVIANLFTDLIGHTVNVTQVLRPPITNVKQVYGIYSIKPSESVRILQVDFPLLASLGGALLGLPSEEVREQLLSPELSGPLSDAVHETLNIASRIVSIDHRAVFQTMHIGIESLPNGMAETLKNPAFRSYFTITVQAYEAGAFSILAPI
jgi:hypothetical protein